jgi:spore germination protein KB
VKGGVPLIEKGKIGVHQFTVITILFTLGSSILIVPSGLAHEAKQDAWIASALGLLVGLLVVMLYNRLGTRYPHMTLVAYSQEILGKWLGITVSFLYFCFFFILAALVLRNIGDFMATQVLIRTPIQFIHVFFLGVVILGVRNGLETFIRTAEIFLPWVFFFFFLMVVLLPPQMEFNHVLPVFGYGIKPILRAAVPLIGTPYMELVVFLILFPYISNVRKAGKAFLAGVFIGGLMLIIISLLSILVLGADLTASQMYPSYGLAKKISIGDFIERLEVIMAGIWFITIYFKLSICFYASTTTFAQLLRLKDARQLYYPFGMIMIVFSIIAYPDTAYFITFATRIWVVFSTTFGLLLPILLLSVAMVRNKKSPTSERSD